jgi:APA family basic amino acid/polyamine antiporter
MGDSLLSDAPKSPESSLVRAIGVWGLAASIVNVTVGGGIFRLPALVAASLGPTAPIAYIVCAVAMGLIVLCMAEAGSRVSLTGGPYAYVEVALGPFVGFLSGVLLWLLGTLAVAAVSVVFVANIGALLPSLGQGIGDGVVLVLVFALLSAVNISGVREGTALNTVAAAAKLGPLLLLILVGALAVSPANLVWPKMPAAADVARTSILLIFAFSGVECALVPSGEVKDVSRTVPKAIGIAMVAITILYIAVQLVAQGVLGAGLSTATATPLAEVASRVMGQGGRALLLGGATLSMFGYVSGMTLAVPRALFAFARDGFLPGAIASVHPRFRTPYVAILIQSAIVCTLALTSTFDRLAILANLATLILYGTCCVAAWELRRRDVRTGGIPFRAPAPGVLPFAACGVILWMLTSVHADEWAALGLCLAVASVLFYLSRGSRTRLRH